jgi:ribosome-associated protein YbcJ (S4-like RNA binding protein)
VTAEVEVSHQDVALNTLLVLIPVSQKGGTVKNEIAVRVRGGEHALLVENERVKVADGSLKLPLRERWTLEVTETDVRVLIDDKEFHRQAHKLTITENYRVELQGSAKLEAPKGAKVRFDNVKIEP